MSKVFFISDLHFDHKTICKYTGHYRGNCKTVEEHNAWIIKQYNSVVAKRDLVWILGDVSFSKKGISNLSKLNGVKHLILGNHDTFPLSEYLKYCNKIHGFMKYKSMWLSHAPILETRGRINIHGHTHSNIIRNGNYLNVSVEALDGKPIELKELLSK